MAYQDVCGSPVREVFGHAGRWAPVARPSGLCRNGPSPRRQLRNRKTDRWNHAGRDDASGCVSLGRCAQIGARRQLRGPVTFASGCRATVFEPNVPPSLGTAARARFGLGLPFLREGAGRDRRSEGNLQNRCAVCQNHACRGAEETPGLLSGRCGGDFCNGLEATPDRPRRARESHLWWCTTSTRAFFGRRRAESLLLGATPVRPFRKGITPVVAPGCVPWPLRGRRGDSGALELAPELPRARIRDLRLSWLGCGQRLPREPAEQLQAPGIILQRRHAPCDNPPFATPTCHQPLRAVWCAHILFGGCDPSVGRALRPPPFGRCDVKPRAPVPSLGRCDVTPCAPASRPCLSWEAGWRRCAATAPSYAEGGAVTLRGP